MSLKHTSLIQYQIVLANGSLVNANAQSNPDLWWALKGGSNNFGKQDIVQKPQNTQKIRLGIVTAFTLSTYPIHEVWGGIKSYTLDQLPALFHAAIEYQSKPNKDPYANFMMQAFTTNASVGAVLNMVYLKPEASPPAFSPFYSIPTTGDTTKI
ncbi:hypothetical protein OEA41_001246 [Lepraria neglecta]|uniref:Uncharacterized protein n=1 Tax=Lepraria neglecta TaxID=209136 RepID=A0AAD9ZJS3_9LECA|nr:hypothetical protein OEA41_001246 [Lepraria neglecta]